MNRLDVTRLAESVRQRSAVGLPVEILDETDSTNSRCHERGGDPSLSGLVIVAEHQTAGRGQRGSAWSAPPSSSLLFSILLHPDESLSSAPFLTAWAACGIARTVGALGIDARIKWPNDILVDGRKLCGILVERRHATVVGIGLNVSIMPHEFPTNLRLPATSLQMETGREIDRTSFFIDLLNDLDASYSAARREGPESVWKAWPAFAEDLIGSTVLATTTSGLVTGKLIDLRPDRGATIHQFDGAETAIPPEHLVRVQRHEEL